RICRCGRSFSWRLDMAKALALCPITGAERWGDVVLARKEVPTSYHLSVVMDDAAQGITHVVRGLDLEASTSVHRLLQKMLGLNTPHYIHHRLVLDETGKRLAKSVKSTALSALRADGMAPDDVRQLIGWHERELDAYSLSV
ncbi:MAG: glutamate--tRNA ligase family protein, partial [Pseudomonadota bacterium]